MITAQRCGVWGFSHGMYTHTEDTKGEVLVRFHAFSFAQPEYGIFFTTPAHPPRCRVDVIVVVCKIFLPPPPPSSAGLGRFVLPNI